ncbi:MAG TPA: hypothetical protein VIW23_06780, partial [Candidatus Acidoferrum sp.]
MLCWRRSCVTDWMSQGSSWSIASRHIARRAITGASGLGLFVFLACFLSGMVTPRASGAQKPNGHEKQ